MLYFNTNVGATLSWHGCLPKRKRWAVLKDSAYLADGYRAGSITAQWGDRDATFPCIFPLPWILKPLRSSTSILGAGA